MKLLKVYFVTIDFIRSSRLYLPCWCKPQERKVFRKTRQGALLVPAWKTHRLELKSS